MVDAGFVCGVSRTNIRWQQMQGDPIPIPVTLLVIALKGCFDLQ